MAMNNMRRRIAAIILVLICVLIHVYSLNAARVEAGYSLHYFTGISKMLRYLFGWLPFSFGDILYLLAFVWLISAIIRLFISIARKRRREQGSKKGWAGSYKALVILCSVYIIFNIFWGINYNRQGITQQLGLTIDKYTTGELKTMNCILLQKVNSSKAVLVAQHRVYPGNKELITGISDAYEQVAKKYSFLSYTPVSFKASMWGWLGNYTGFTGYYNPFTGEAQLNTTVPAFLQPYTSCHEVAHQLGYAKEMEANFVGYLAAAASTDTLFHYSVYLDLFSYANRNLYYADSVSAKIYRKELSAPVKADIEEWISFSRRHQNPIEPFIRWGYGIFLRSNQQPLGILSYDEVTGFIIAYYKKFGKI